MQIIYELALLFKKLIKQVSFDTSYDNNVHIYIVARRTLPAGSINENQNQWSYGLHKKLYFFSDGDLTEPLQNIHVRW